MATTPHPNSQANQTPGSEAPLSTGGLIPNPDTDAQASQNPEAASASTQEHMGDGAGIRGSYGDASQTNGLEGGPQTSSDDLTRRGVGS